MILSRFSEIIQSNEGRFFLFNCLTRNWIEFDDALANFFVKFSNTLDAIKELHPDLYAVLENEKFIVDDTDIEEQDVVNKITEDYLSTNHVEITINPTLDCNLRCWYCYEEHREKSVMEKDTINHTISYIKTFLKKHEVKTLRISFFGGEPLLYFKKVIVPLVSDITEACKQTSTELYFSFTTNGLLLSKPFFAFFKEVASKVNIQVAFDGNRDLHNKVKYLGTDFSCYDSTIANVKNAIEKGFQVVVRCNYAKDTIDSFIDVIEAFKEFHTFNNLRFSFQKIWQASEDEGMLNVWHRFVTKIDSKYMIKSNIHNLLGNSLNRCYADYKHNFVINYDGLVFRCTARDFSKANSIGQITEKGLIITRNQSNSIFGEAPYGEKCKKCRILPICPVCSQVKMEKGIECCPINISEEDMVINIRAAFQDLTGIKVKSDQSISR